jgi:hypothetical protein
MEANKNKSKSEIKNKINESLGKDEIDVINLKIVKFKLKNNITSNSYVIIPKSECGINKIYSLHQNLLNVKKEKNIKIPFLSMAQLFKKAMNSQLNSFMTEKT